MLEPGRIIGGRHCSRFRGSWVRDDALAAFRVMALMGDPEATPEDRAAVLPMVMLPDGGSLALCLDAAWELCGIDLTGAHEGECGGASAVDWERDEGIAKASLMAAYGLRWADAVTCMPYRDLMALVMLLPRDTPMGQAVYYRTADMPKGLSDKAREEWLERRDFWQLADDDTAADASATAAFEAIKAMGAKRG